MRRYLAFALLAAGLAGSASLGALEIKAGIVKAVIDESTARVSLYKLTDIAKGRYDPLLFDVDPRTSYATLSFAGKQSKLGDSSEFRLSVARTETGARLSFRSAFCSIDEDLVFVSSVGTALPDGILVRYTIQNISQKDADVGLRCLFDTWLGEKGNQHFRTDLKPRINGETLIEGPNSEAWISSPGERAELMVILRGGGVAGPDKAVLANWKRINDEPWIPEVIPGRSFTLLPYSVNDSALALYWQPANLGKGESRTCSTILGCFNEAGYPETKAGDTDGTSALFSKSILENKGASPAQSMANDLLTVRDLLSQMDLAVVGGKPLTAEEIAAWRKILDSLEERKKGY
jgi:hypothetical protein